MNKKDYDRQALTDYLLGALPEAETEYFDELSIADDDFAGALSAAENDLVDSYARGELSDAELEKFKSRYLASPRGSRKADFARAFQIFAEKNAAAASPEISAAAEEPDSKRTFAGFFSALNIFSPSNAVLRWSFAAAILFLVVSGVWILLKNAQFGQLPDELLARQEQSPENGQNSQVISTENLSTNLNAEKEPAKAEEKPAEQLPAQKRSPKPSPLEPALRKSQDVKPAPPGTKTAPRPKVSIASFILAPPLRGSSQIQTISVSSETDFVAMQLEMESDDYASYRLALIDRSTGKKLWQSGPTGTKTRGADKHLNIRFPAALLKPQIYSLEVSGIAADGAVEITSDYSFRVVR